MLKKFKLWESEQNAAHTKASLISDIEKAFGEKLFVVKDFSTIEKEGEPLQKTTLCSLQSGHSFGLNFSGEKLYSVDFWMPTSTKSVGTLYLDKSGMSTEDLVSQLPALVKNPKIEESILEYTNKKATTKPAKIEPAKPAKTVITDQGAKEVVKDIEKATKADEYEDYEYGDKDTIFEDFRRYVRMVIKGVQPAFLCTGMPGVGKDFITKQELEKAGLVKEKDYFKITGKASAPAMYQALHRYNGKLLVFSDCDSVFDKEDGVNVLKGALESDPDERIVTWGVGNGIKDTETGEKIPTRFLFTGKVIFLSNRSKKSLKKVDAVKSRSFTLEVALSPSDMLAYIEEMLPKIEPNKPMALKKTAMNTIKSVAKANSSVKLNMRTLLKAVVILEEIDDLVVAKRMIVQQCS